MKNKLLILAVAVILGFIAGFYLAHRLSRPDPAEWIRRAEYLAAIKERERQEMEFKEKMAAVTAALERKTLELREIAEKEKAAQAQLKEREAGMAQATLNLAKAKAEAAEIIKENAQVKALVQAYEQRLELEKGRGAELAKLLDLERQRSQTLVGQLTIKDRQIELLTAELDRERNLREMAQKLILSQHRRAAAEKFWAGVGKLAGAGAIIYGAIKLL